MIVDGRSFRICCQWNLDVGMTLRDPSPLPCVCGGTLAIEKAVEYLLSWLASLLATTGKDCVTSTNPCGRNYLQVTKRIKTRRENQIVANTFLV